MNYLFPSFYILSQSNTSIIPTQELNHVWIGSQLMPQNYFNLEQNLNLSCNNHFQFSQTSRNFPEISQNPHPKVESSTKIKAQQEQNKKQRRRQLNKTKRIQKQNKKNKCKTSQNPKRNVITNLGNQLLSFIGNKFKLSLLFQKIFQNIQEELMTSLLVYIRKIKRFIGSYLNIDKLRQFWFQGNGKRSHQKTLKLFRKVSYYYLTNYSHIHVCKSLKLNADTKAYHLQGRRILISALKRQITYQ